MQKIIFILFLLFPLLVNAQIGEMRVYTVAGSLTATALGDGGPATAASLSATEGIWLDGQCNIYLSDMGHSLIRKVDASTGIITTIAGTGGAGYSGDGGLATNATMGRPYGLYADPLGNVYFADVDNNRVRRIDAITGIITNFAGGGTSLGDGGPATNAQLNTPQNVYKDSIGNLYIGEIGRIRKVSAGTGNITTIAGTGTVGLSGDNGPATNAQISNGPSGMLLDASENLIFADRTNCRVRKVNRVTGIITTVAGTTPGYSGDGGLATNAQFKGIISFSIDCYGNLIVGDNNNNVIRKVDAVTGIVSTIAGDTSISATYTEGALATSTGMHPEFLYLDLSGNIYFTQWVEGSVRKIINYNPGKVNSTNMCGFTSVPELRNNNSDNVEIYPNPIYDLLNIDNIKTNSTYLLLSIVGAVIQQGTLKEGNNTISLQTIANGMYMLELTDDEGKKSVTKIIKQ
jgi:hypothetical protein